ncbi:Serine protease S53 [Mycena venus]|uniref:tripeptidyl-peptidase II n=1 Tax=Mycena venus TaxID=2733690 RepID=A0A8H7D5W4_9AGAR|nr:Serine protease S53 [Mycena venus]
MRFPSFIPALMTALATASINPMDRRAMTVHESVAVLPSGFAHSGSVSPDQEITLRIALVQSDIVGLQSKTYAVSDPANVLYGQHLTVDEVATFVRPTAVTVSEVSGWLQTYGITAKSVSPAGDLLQITVPVSTANTLLSAQFSSFTHTASGKTSIRTLSYSIPASLQSHIQFIHPTVAFVPPLTAPSLNRVKVEGHAIVEERVEPTSNTVTSCANTVTPSCIEALYGFPTAKANHSAQNIIGVAGYTGQYASYSDLALFLKNLQPDLVGSNFTVMEIDGGVNTQAQGQAGDEADLDIEMTVGLAGGVPTTFISVGADYTDDIWGFIDIANSILAAPIKTRPTVLTTSYGFNENTVPVSVSIGMCNAYTQLGAVGISVLFASGDGGVSGLQPTSCSTFQPTVPGTCPFITSVGGSSGLAPQTAAALSAGGFSNIFPTPAYQAAEVAAYIASIGDEYAGLYNTSGRGIPDVALQALDVEFVWDGSLYLVGGTSCATPIFAALIALVNDRLTAAGKPVMGFLNPFLYSSVGKAAFTDITSGNNPGCNTNGFYAAPGWDPVTGLGTPNFNALLTAVGL